MQQNILSKFNKTFCNNDTKHSTMMQQDIL